MTTYTGTKKNIGKSTFSVTNAYSKFKMNSKLQLSLFIIIVLIILTYNIPLRIIQYESNTHIISLTEDQALVNTVSSKFLSFGLDTSLLRSIKDLPFGKPNFINLAQHLSPAYVRIGGTDADCLLFNQADSGYEKDLSNFTITDNDFIFLYIFSQKAQIKIVFDLNVLLRNNDGSWNSDNAKEIILFAKSHNMELDWQLGNEPNSFHHVFNVSISAEQLAQDYCQLRILLNEFGYQESTLVGPEANHIVDENHGGAVYAKKFLDNIDNCIDHITWHQYYLNGHIAQVEDFVNSTVFNNLSEEINTMTKVIESSGRKISMWISETSSAYGGGAPKLSDRFVAGFLWLDKLGYSAKTGIQVLIRQSLFGGNYAMIGKDLLPNPDWWIAVIFKQFVSEKVLNLSTPNNFGNIRLYAHCASTRTFIKGKPAVVIYGININKAETNIYIQWPQKESKIYSYILTSDNLQSRNIFMNGNILKLQSDGSLPPFIPNILKVNQIIRLPPYSMIFLVIHGGKISACVSSST